ncbi:hypothetical protein HMPREF1153_2410 [Selenomonas sp. CM52]|nr:hypothetical protein HMPREF1153_2410 [Selenomonas sp. CM52]
MKQGKLSSGRTHKWYQGIKKRALRLSFLFPDTKRFSSVREI